MRILMGCLLAFTLVACGGETGGNKKSSDTPKCSTVWIDGKTLPKGYDGCVEKDGDTYAGVSNPCTKGRDLFTYEPKSTAFWNTTDGVIHEATVMPYAGDPAYAKASTDCAG